MIVLLHYENSSLGLISRAKVSQFDMPGVDVNVQLPFILIVKKDTLSSLASFYTGASNGVPSIFQLPIILQHKI